MKRFWANKRMDASFADWCFAIRASTSRRSRDVAGDIEERWARDGLLIGLSVRSLFDLWLTAAGWGRGDRIVFTAFTVADMPAIARAHGIEVAAVDIDPRTCEPDLDLLRELVDDRTRAVVYSHLFGARGEVGGALEIAQSRDARFVEDCAEAYAGPGWWGHPAADVALFSFGPIKTATAFGGGVARIADEAMRTEVQRLAAELPQQPRADYARRLLKFGALHAATAPRTFAVDARDDAALDEVDRPVGQQLGVDAEVAVIGDHKARRRGKVVATFALGSQRLYDFLHENPVVELLGVDWVNDPRVIGSDDCFISINATTEVDLLGQCASETIGGQYWSGSGGQADFARGAMYSERGQGFIVLHSTAADESISRITARLSSGSVVTTTKNTVDHVVTEYGVADLRGRSIRDRALELIAIAHPKFRDELTAKARELDYL